MIDLYTSATPNGRIPLLALHEMELPFTLHNVALYGAAHYTPEFLALNPTAQIPVIVDRDPALGEPVVLSQTTAILLYLAEKTGRFLPEERHRRARALEGLALHSSDLAPAFYLAFHLERLLSIDDAKVRSALRLRGFRYYNVLEGRLGEEPYLAGPECSIADLAAYPWARMFDAMGLAKLPGLARWRDRVEARPAAAKAMNVGLSLT